MKIEFLSKNYVPSEKLKDIISKKVDKLNKFFEEDTKVKIFFKESNEVHTLELTIVVDSILLRSEVSSGNMYENIDIALPKLEKQIIKHRTKIASKSKKFRIKELDLDYIHPVNGEDTVRGVVKSKSYQLSPMTVEDAVEELELVGHSFYVFCNKATDNVNVVYKRNDGDYGLIEAVV